MLRPKITREVTARYGFNFLLTNGEERSKK